MKKILLFGCHGQVGSALVPLLEGDCELIPLDIDQLDLTRVEQIQQAIDRHAPDLIINAAAYTAVDKAESDSDICYAVNARAPEVMARQAAVSGAAIIHYSTDYVFDGSRDTPYSETDVPNPLGVYGSSKLQGDRAVLDSGAAALVFRTSWVYGATGKNFYLTMRKLLQERGELNVVDDQFGSPTLASAIATATVDIIQQAGEDLVGYIKKHTGLYNMTCGGESSWYGFTKAIASGLADSPASLARVNPVPTSAYPTPAKRPAYTVLDNSKLYDAFLVKLPPWQQALQETMKN